MTGTNRLGSFFFGEGFEGDESPFYGGDVIIEWELFSSSSSSSSSSSVSSSSSSSSAVA